MENHWTPYEPSLLEFGHSYVLKRDNIPGVHVLGVWDGKEFWNAHPGGGKQELLFSGREVLTKPHHVMHVGLHAQAKTWEMLRA